VPLHPVLVEFQRLIDCDPIVRQYLNRLIAEEGVFVPESAGVQ